MLLIRFDLLTGYVASESVTTRSRSVTRLAVPARAAADSGTQESVVSNTQVFTVAA